MGVTPLQYSWVHFADPFAVYIKVAVDWRFGSGIGHYRQRNTMMYIGSTGVSVTLREANRMSVLRKLEQGKEAQAELAIRYWHQNSCFQQFTLIKIASCCSYRAAWTLEHELISQWQPKLNFPFVQVFLKRTALGFRPARRQRFASFSKFGLRLWRKLRKRLFHSVQPFECAVRRRQAWEILYDLSSFTRASFEAVKHLRSQKMVDDEVYAIVRLSLCLEEPLRTRVRKLLRKVVEHRKMTWPKQHQTSLSIPFLAHSSFVTSLDAWLKTLVLRFRSILVPFHLPASRVREASLQSCKDLLHNVHVWNRSLLSKGESCLTCKCADLQLPSECFVDGHLAAGIELLGPLHYDLWYLGQGSANSTFFPSKTKFLTDALQSFDKWRCNHGMPSTVVASFRVFMLEQWKLHEQCVQQQSRLDWKRVQNCKKALREFVVHCEDHHPNHLMAFCPLFYFASVQRTWADPLVFQQLNTEPAELKSWVLAQIPPQIQRRYPRGVDSSGSLPVGFVLLKRKKLFRKGRTIVSYLHAPLRRLLAGAAYAIQLMLCTVWQGLDLSIPEIWRRVHQFFQDMPSSVLLLEFNDDLVGFFNSVPREMIISALQMLIRDYQNETGVHVFTVDLRKSTASAQRALPNKPRGGRSNCIHTLDISHLVEIVQLSFRTGVFVANHKCFQQVRGTCIGNQISPVLSSLPVILRERIWMQSLSCQLADHGLRTSHLFLCRYVDNRLVLADRSTSDIRAMQEFLHPGFYGASIELEKVDDHGFLGFTLCMRDRSVTYRQPVNPWQIRHFCSAGSLRIRTAGFHSRKALIQKYTWPPEARKQQVQFLQQLYVARGFTFDL